VNQTGAPRVRVCCGECKLENYFAEAHAYEDVDYYNKFTDAYYHDLAITLRDIYTREERLERQAQPPTIVETQPPLVVERIRELHEEVRPTDIYEGGEYIFPIVKDYLVDGRMNGVAKVKNIVVFVPGARKGEVVKARIKNFVDRAFAIAQLIGRLS